MILFRRVIHDIGVVFDPFNTSFVLPFISIPSIVLLRYSSDATPSQLQGNSKATLTQRFHYSPENSLTK